MRSHHWAALALALVLVGCGQADKAAPATHSAQGYAAVDDVAEGRAESNVNAPAPAPPPPGADQTRGGQSPAPTTPNPGGPSPARYLAYAHQMALELPAARVIGVMDAHVRACQQASERVCQVVGASREGDPESAVSGAVSLRAEPVWLRTFMDRIATDADRAGGRVASESTSTEDLTRDIVDTEARLRATRALRERLQRLLESRPGRLSDLLEVERELSRVQGEIDSTESNLAVMRTRVEMSTLTLNYQSSPQSLRSDTFKPLGDAFANFLGFLVQGFAAIITIIALLLPWALVASLIGWALLAWRRRRGGHFIHRNKAPLPPAEKT